MRAVITIGIFLLTMLSFPLLAGNENPTFCGGVRNHAFLAGESLTYKVSYSVAGMRLAVAGEATFTTTFERFNGKDVYHIVGEGKSYPFLPVICTLLPYL